jgi:hypothetical protein
MQPQDQYMKDVYVQIQQLEIQDNLSGGTPNRGLS